MNITKNIVLVLFAFASILTSCSSDDKETETEVVDTATLKTFKDVAFTLDSSEGFDAARFFSTETGKSYKKSAIDAAILPKIDIAFFGSSSMTYFVSPSDVDNGVAGGKTTEFVNYVTDEYTADQFAKLEKGEDLAKLEISEDGDSFSTESLPKIVLFKTAAGKKGVILVKSAQKVGFDPKIVVDIKIQK